jgi:hypothetical protein
MLVFSFHTWMAETKSSREISALICVMGGIVEDWRRSTIVFVSRNVSEGIQHARPLGILSILNLVAFVPTSEMGYMVNGVPAA